MSEAAESGHVPAKCAKAKGMSSSAKAALALAMPWHACSTDEDVAGSSPAARVQTHCS